MHPSSSSSSLSFVTQGVLETIKPLGQLCIYCRQCFLIHYCSWRNKVSSIDAISPLIINNLAISVGGPDNPEQAVEPAMAFAFISASYLLGER
jgi:hypothetical protein